MFEKGHNSHKIKPVFFFFFFLFFFQKDNLCPNLIRLPNIKAKYFLRHSKTSMTRIPLGPWKFIRGVGSSKHYGLIKMPG